MLALRRATGDDVDDAKKRAGSVEHRARPAHDFDACDVGKIDVKVMSYVAMSRGRVVDGVTVDENEHAIGVVAGRREAAEPHRLVAAIVRGKGTTGGGQRFGQGGVAEGSYLVGGDDTDGGRRRFGGDGRFGSGRDFGIGVGQVGIHESAFALLHVDRFREGASAFLDDLDVSQAGRHTVDDGRGEAGFLAVDANQCSRDVGANDDRTAWGNGG